MVLLGLCFYGFHRYALAYLYYRHRDDRPRVKTEITEWPKMTIQLPIFNERLVVERLIDYVCKLDYPADRLQIQVLDDSTDETTVTARRRVEYWQREGVDIVYIHRVNRAGFKAGALEAGLKSASGELVAIFDADFTPKPSFLKDTVPYFSSEEIGMVQARWGHLNREYSFLTQAQSILLDGHFVIEHTARNRSGRFFNFNGTAGIWRKACIEDAGGWQHDTLTEDLDLSYRAQLKGWKFVFLNDVISPAELPVEVSAFKNQQHRWAKGSIQVCRKLLPRILKSDQPRKVKVEAFVHLSNNVAYVLMVCLSAMLPLALRIRVEHQWNEALLIDLPCFVGATLSFCMFYLVSQKEQGGPWIKRICFLPFVLALGIGLAVNNTKATLEAILGHQSPFVRTPKTGIEGKGRTGKVIARYRIKHSLLPVLELAFAISFANTALYCVEHSLWLALPFILLFFVGFLYTGLMSIYPIRYMPRQLAQSAS